ncbi:ATPase, T2SS/T4P/T4SS family [Paenibacillus sp. GXUN7292]|uniref:ATPase, T2SS/T4P/T4SS family n=1 Tax=Paenibacillus sp. GXUN7292 TaxID=3422499 RepID=UPI003D7EB66C
MSAVQLKERPSTSIPMRVRIPFDPAKYMKDIKLLNHHNRQTSAIKRNDGKIPLSEAASIIYEHLMERSKTDSNVHQDIINAGLGEPLAQERMRSIIDTLIMEYRLDIDPSTLIDNWSPAECVFAETCGASLIEDLVKLPDVEEVQVLGQDIFLIRSAEQELHHRKFPSIKAVELLQDRLALCGKKPINDAHPVLQTYMYNGSRLVMTRPGYTDVPSIHIRNFIVKNVSLDNMVSLRTINSDMALLLQRLVKFHASFLIGGSTNTGKTTFLFSLCSEIPEHERIRSLEVEFEVNLRKRLPGKRNILAARAIPEAGLPMEEAFKPLLVMSPHWVVVGESKGAEVSQAIQGSLRGHNVISTIHTNDRESLISDIVDMVKQDGRNHEYEDVIQRVARAFPIVIYLRIININGKMYRVVSEITHFYVKDNRPRIEPLFKWDYDNQLWTYTGAAFSESFKERLISSGATSKDFEFLPGVWGV